MSDKILMVDDDPNLLSAVKRHYRKRYNLTTVENADDALAVFEEKEPVFVVVVDMRMPGMDGLHLLQRIGEISPNTVRIMLTGNADQQTAVDAINQGHIFRFFNKPCDLEMLAAGIDAGITQYKLVTAEQELLEQTLAGGVKILVDVLSIVDPVSFGRSHKIRAWAQIVSRNVKLEQPWRLIIAAMLSQLGNITIPSEVMAKISQKLTLSEAEQEIVDAAPAAARDLIVSIPRLKPVSEIVYLQHGGTGKSAQPDDELDLHDIPVEARILQILIALEKHSPGAYPSPKAFEHLLKKSVTYDLKILREIRTCLETAKSHSDEQELEEIELPTSALKPGYVLLSDLKLENGRLLLSAGIELLPAHIQKITAFAKMHTLAGSIKVQRQC
jgi:response regulator RpfG family c-di-GMP phosphodiesterase